MALSWEDCQATGRSLAACIQFALEDYFEIVANRVTKLHGENEGDYQMRRLREIKLEFDKLAAKITTQRLVGGHDE